MVSYEIDTEAIAQNIIEHLDEIFYDFGISFYTKFSEEEAKKVITEIAKQMISLVKE